MELRFSRCSVALLLLLFVAVNALRGPGVPVDEPKLPAPRSRGSSRFNAQSARTTESPPDSIPIQKSLNRRGSSNRKTNGFNSSPIEEGTTLKTTKIELNSNNRKFEPKKSINKNQSTTSSTNDEISTTNRKVIFNKKNSNQRHLIDNNSPEVGKFQKVSTRSRQLNRNIQSDQAEKIVLDKNGPSIFSATNNSDDSRLRTGRKIQTTFTQRELRSEIPASKRFASRRSDDDDLNSEKIEKKIDSVNNLRKIIDHSKRDSLPAGSENINVPAILQVTRRSAPSTQSTITEEIDSRKSRQRGRTSFAESVRSEESSRSDSRRVPSRSDQIGNDEIVNRRNGNRFSKDEVDTIKMRSSEMKSRIGDSDLRSRGRGQDASSIIQDGRTMGTSNERRNGRSRNQEDSRKRSRNRSRIEQSKSSESTTSQETVTAFPEVTASGGRTDFDSGSLIISSRSATTVSPNSRIVSTTTSRATRRESEGTTSTRSRERTGTSRRKASKEDFYNHGLGFRGRRPLPDSSTVGTIITTEIPQRIVTTTIIPQESQARGNPGWSLHRRPYTGAESSLVTTEEEITTTSGSATKSPGRRGNKTFVKAPGDSPIISANHENIDDENYPPDFKEKLAQLKNLGSSSGAKATTRSPLQGNKKASTSLFSARSRMKLENARKLVKPELLDEETNLQTDSINERKNLDIEEEKKLENKLSDLHTESTLGQESVVKPKLARPKKNDETNKIHNFTPKSRISSVKEDGKNKSQNSTRNSDSFSKSRSTFKIRSKPKVENRIEANNSLGRGKSFTRRTNKTNDYSTTQKPKSTSIRRSLKNTEENKLKSSTSSRKPISRYRNASTGKSGSKYKFSRTSTTNQINSNSIGEITENPVTMKNYISVTRSLSTTISEEISTKKLRTKLFNDLSRSSVDETRLLKTKKEPTKINETTTTPTTTLATKNVRPTSRYSRNKVQVFKTDSILKSNVTNSDQSEKKIVNSTQKIDPRSRTATYRRHSEVAQSLLRSSTVEPNSIEITPKATRFQVSTSNPSPQLVTQEPVVNVKVSNDSNSVQQQSLQILQDGNTFTGNSGNIFNPTKNVLVTAGNVTLLEQIRGTVAPLLGSLGARSPIFSGIYNNASNINTAVRITPNGSPPRFSARYKGAELFVRNPSISQSAIPTITSSTTPFTPIENSGLPPPIEVSSNGEPKVLTFYQALESASITDEQLKTNLQQLGRVAQVDRLTDNDPNGTNSSNNDIEPITVAVTTTKSTFITPKEILPSDAIPPTPEATQTPDRTPTTSENPTTFEMISTSELNPPLADVSTFLDVNNRIQAATTTISTTSTEAEDATSFSNIPNFSNNDIGDLEFSRNVAINTDSSNLEATTIGASQENVRTTEATSTTEMNVFIVTPVKPEDTTDSGFETTTELISKSSFESTRSILDSTSEIVPNSTPEFIPNFTPEFSTESSSKVSSLNDEALYATSNFRATTDEETFQKLTNFDGKNEFLGSASTVNPARTSVLNRGYFSTEIPVFTDGFLSTTDRVVDINNRGNFFENYASTEVPFSLTETPSTEISRQLPTTATETQLSGMSSTEMPSTIAISSTTEVPSTTTVSSTTTVQSTTLSSTTEFPTTTETSTTEMPTTTTSTELPTTTMSSAGRVMTSSTTKRTLTTPKIIPSTLIPMGGFPRLPKLQSFLDTLAQLGNPTIKSQVMENIETTTMIDPNIINESTTPLGILTTNSAIFPRIKETNYDPRTEMTSAPVSLIDQTTFTSSITGSKNPLDVDVTLDENFSTTGQTSFDLSTPLSNQMNLNIVKDEFMNMTQSWINDGDSDTPFDNELLSRLMNVATKLSPKSPNDTELMSKTPQNRPPVDKMPSLLGGFLDNTDRTQTTESTTTVDIDTTLAPILNSFSRLIEQTPRAEIPETTNYPSLITDSQTNDAPSTIAPVLTTEQSIDSRSTKSPQTQTASILDLYAMLSDLVTKAPTKSSAPYMGTQEFTLTPNSTELVEETTPNTPLETTTGSFITTPDSLPNPETVIPNVLTRFQDSSSATAQTTARPNFISSNLLDFPSSSRNPTTPSTRLLPTSFGVNFPTTTTRLLPTGTYSPPLSNFGTSLPPLNNFGTTPPPLNNFGTTPSPLNNFGTTPSPLNNFGTTPPVNNFRTTFPPLNNFETTLPSLNNVETTSSPLNNVGTTSPPLSNIGTTPPAATTIPPPNNIGTTLLPMNNDGSNFPTSTSSPSTTAASSSKLLSNDATRVMNPAAGSTPTMTTPYMGRFGGSRLTPAPRFSSSSSTTAPLRDYLIYGIYPNKTIVRKRPEDNLIDARNIDSPYVIFGIYPDGRLVRKFPNGTVIPDPPSNPVEVVFSLSTSTTTNRPSLPVFTDNQANQGFRNQNAALSNPVATLEKQISLVGTNDVDNGLSGNAIGPIGTTTSPVPPSVSTTQKMVINAPNATSSVPSATSSSSSNSNVVAGSNGSQQGGRIIQDRERDEATRTREAGGQRNSMYIGQDKYINYWINDQPNSNPQVLNVKINSVSTASSQGTGNSPPKLPSFHLSPNSGSGTITVAPNFAWKDPLDQIFGITTNSPPISASVASNILDDVNAQIFASKSSGISSTTSTTSSTLAPTTTTTVATNPTTTFVPFTTTSTTNLKLVNTPDGLFTTNIPKENPFGTTYDDLAFLNTLLNTQRFGRTTPKTLTEVEKLLADKILSLALGKAGPTRSPKAIQPSNASPNLLIETDPNPESGPVVIDLYPSSTTEKSNTATWKPITSTSPVIVNPWKTLLNGIAANQIHISTPNSVSGVSSSLRSLYEQQTTVSSIPRTTTVTTTTSTTPRTTTTTTPKTTTTTTTTTPRTTTTTTPKTTTTEKITTTQRTTTTVRTSTTTPLRTSTTPAGIPTRQLEITSRPSRPRTTTTAPRLGFGANLLRTLFGGNFFGIPTTPTPVRNKRPVRPLTTVIPITSTQIIEQIPKGPFSNLDAIHLIPDVTKKNPNLEAASSSAVDSKLTQSTTFSPEEDAKFLLALLNAAQTMGSSTLSPMGQVSKDDEAFLRAILNGQPSIQPPSLKGENVKSDAALLAALLKAEGIEPSTPANQLREQLLVAGLDKNRDARSSTTSTTTTTTVRTTTRPRPAAPTWKPSSTYPPPLFGGFNFAGSSDSFKGDSNENVRSQVVNAAIGVTRAFSQFLGGAIMGAAKQLQSFVGNGTRSFFS